MPILQLTMDRRYNGQQCISNFFYTAAGTPASVTLSFALMSAFGCIPEATVYPAGSPFATLRLLQDANVKYIQAVARNLYSVTDFYELPFPANLAGLVDGGAGAMSSYEAFSFRTNRVRTDIQRGHKRYEGVTEGGVQIFGDLTDAQQALNDAHAVALTNTLTYDDEGNTISFTPCVRQLQRVVDVDGKVTYEKWATEAEALAHVAEGVLWTADAVTSTQNSRKVGRGS